MSTAEVQLSLRRGDLPQRVLLDHLRDRTHAADARAQAAAGELTEARLRETPRGGGWSVGQLLEHLTVAAREYLAPLERKLAARPAPPAPDARWRPSFAGRLLIAGLDERSTRRFRAPRRWDVTAVTPQPDALAHFLASQERVRGAIELARTRDVQRVRLASPVMAVLRMNAGDALAVLIVHAERHIAQMERAVRQSS